jgi:hypothetical protein
MSNKRYCWKFKNRFDQVEERVSKLYDKCSEIS